jgi:hypothetical protein
MAFSCVLAYPLTLAFNWLNYLDSKLFFMFHFRISACSASPAKLCKSVNIIFSLDFRLFY